VMGISAENVFADLKGESSTASLFLGPFLVYRLLSVLYHLAALCFEPKFARQSLPLNGATIFASLPWFIQKFNNIGSSRCLWQENTVKPCGGPPSAWITFFESCLSGLNQQCIDTR
jgi:hypothetical protein